MLRKFQNKLYALFLGSFTMVITACYGVPAQFVSVEIQTVNPENIPISGLKVSIYQNYKDTSYLTLVDTSNNAGNTNFSIRYSEREDFDFSAKIEDIDSTKNGVYSDSIFKLDEKTENYTIKMK